ncbi:tetratricopeptide repeat protein [Piscinibacter sp. XHJ-5]|uniref:tetratricopeptide repeat protein n=1 Tax=Piscinibacter sp. XHJ-5 TaxID=3037797 RepID=UPI00245359FC|nr:tetratricopeptide repeat protein [Piscinibacter sp. XHJ-5]
MRSCSPSRRTASRWRSLAAAAAIAVAGSGASVAADKAAHPIKDPHYGDTLFHFFQDHYFTSITTLMVSQHFDRVAQHADEAEILRGGMLLSYGLHREAGQIFAQLIEKGASPSVRDRAWFYLAKIRYQRGYLAEADDAIARVENHLPPALEEERGLLKAQLLMARQDYAGAAALLQSMTRSPGAGRYARYNLGVALIRSGDTAGGTALLDELGRTPAENEEQRSLRDKANVAIGFAALQEERADDARKYLERVRLTSMQSNKALLGFGWAAAALKRPRDALVPWTELATRDASDAAVLEARIAVPYAYAELGAVGQALTRYTEAITAFERESTSLDESIAAIRAGKLVDGLIERNPGDEMGWFWNIRELPEMPHAGHLAQVLAQHEFQEAFKNFRDLRFLSRNLQGWAENLVVFDDMLANRRQAYAERLPKILAAQKESRSGLASLQQRRDALARELAGAQAQNDAAAFADAKQHDLLRRLDAVEAALKGAGDGPELAAARERARLAAGALTWQLAQDYPARLWEAQKGLAHTDAQLEQARRHEAALAQAQRDEPARFEAFAQRIAALHPRIQALIPRVAALSREQQGQVQDLAVAELTRQKERLAVYATQARFAVAQLVDRATLSRKADDSPPQ